MHRFFLYPIIYVTVFILPLMAKELSLIPQPREVIVSDGSFDFLGDVPIIYLGNPQSEEDKFAAALLQDEISTVFNLSCTISQRVEKKSITLCIFGMDNIVDKILKSYGITIQHSYGREGYVLLVRPDSILIAANTSTGIFYGVQTLRQIIRSNSEDAQIPCLTIRDWPLLDLRGIQDDISRGPIPTMDFLKEEIRTFAELKFNYLVYYIENAVRINGHGIFSPPGALTLDEIQELQHYAKKYHIELIGSFQSFGHFERILAYPQYEPLGEQGTLLSPAFEGSYRLLADIYREMAPVFHSKFFMVYGDEVWALGRGASEAMVQEKGLASIYAGHMNWIRDELNDYGKRMMMTADVVLEHPEAFSLLKKDIILQPWDYSPRDSFADILQPIQESGFNFVILPGINCWRKIFPNFEFTRDNIQIFIRDALQFGTMGVITTTWDDLGGNFFSSTWYGISFAADQSWFSDNGKTEEFDSRFSVVFYGDKYNRVSEAINLLSNLKRFSVLQGLEYTVFWQQLIPKFGETAQLSLDHWSKIRQEAVSGLKKLDSVQWSRHEVDKEYLQFAADQFIFMADFREDLIQAANSYRQACLIQPQVSESIREIQKTITIINNLWRNWKSLKMSYEKLWLHENRPYWLDVNLEKFTIIENDFADVINRLQVAMQNLENGDFLPPPNQVRLDIEEIDGGFFQTWLVCGSFPNPKINPDLPSHSLGNCAGFDKDYLLSLGGEAVARPKAGSMIALEGSGEKIWYSHTTSDAAKIDFASLFSPKDRTVAYAYCLIEVDEQRTVTAAFGSNDGIKIFLNGQLIFEEHELRFIKIDDDIVELELNKGINHLMIKVDQGRGKWGFAFRLKDQKIINEGCLYRIQ